MIYIVNRLFSYVLLIWFDLVSLNTKETSKSS